MNVELASAELHIGMVEAFGLPTPTQSTYEEAIGWYHFDGETRYWLFKPQTQTWRVASEDYGWNRPNLIASHWSEADRKSVTEAMKELVFMPAPPPPSDISTAVEVDPFLYEGWLFQWHFYPALRRWVLAPLAKN